MINIILFLMSITATMLIGLSILAITCRKNNILSLSEEVALSFPLGAGMISFYLFYISILGADITIASILPLSILCVTGIWMLGRKKSDISGLLSDIIESWNMYGWIKRGLFAFFIVAAIWKLSLMLFNAATTPPIFDDALSCWSYKAKVIYLNGSLETNPSHPLFLGGAYSHYPLGPSLFRVWIAMFMGEWSDMFIQLHSYIVLISILLFVFLSLKDHASLFIRTASVYILASMPLFSTHAYAGYADIILSCHVTISFILLLKWFFSKEPAVLVIAAISTASAVFTKNEGLVLYLPALFFIFSFYSFKAVMKFEDKIKAAMIFTFTISLFAGPWIAFKIYHKIPIW